MKFYIDMDERYPDFSLDRESSIYRFTMELSEEEYADYERVCDAYNAWQGRIEDEVDKQVAERKEKERS